MQPSDQPPIRAPFLLPHLAALSLGIIAALFAVQTLAAQEPAATHKAVRRHTQPAATAKPAQAVPVPPPPPATIDPHWPTNDKPNYAAITWDSQGLRVEASNSSLQQILRDVSRVTGAKVEGLGGDERVFGAYGPGLARDVLSQLLQGSSYNILMIGDLGQGAPREIVLSSRTAGKSSVPVGQDPSAENNDDDSADSADTGDDDQQPQPAPGRPEAVPGGGPRTPQQMLQEMQQRQLEIQRRQQMMNQQPH